MKTKKVFWHGVSVVVARGKGTEEKFVCSGCKENCRTYVKVGEDPSKNCLKEGQNGKN